MAKVKVINTGVPTEHSIGKSFNDTPSNTIFSFGKFFVTTNFDGKTNVNYTNTLSSFVRPITLESINVNDTQSEIIDYYSNNAVLNLDKSDLNTFVRFGSAYEFLRVSIQNIILAYPGSLFANSQKDVGGTTTYVGLNYDEVTNIATFYVPTGSTNNNFGLVFNDGNESIPDDKELKNLNNSFEKYSIWTSHDPDTLFPVVGYTGNTINSAANYAGTSIPKWNHIKLEVEGNPFALIGTPETASYDYHIRPNNVEFEEFRALLKQYEQNIVSKRVGTDGFEFVLKNPTILDDGKIIYSDTQILWNTGDKYNIDINTPAYQKFLRIVLTIGEKYDKVKTDLIARFLTPASLKIYDLTEEGKITKLLRIYGEEFDQIREFIDSLVYINKITYDKVNNAPDQIIKNMANVFGWDYFSLVNEQELVDGFLTVDDKERDLNENILPAEIDVELWRRIINNTSYFWKSKGTRHAIKSMFLLIGIPEPFINITEYVYTVDGKINPNTVPLTQAEFPSNSLPYDSSGYPVAPLETSDFYFQISGNSDSGQEYLDVFRDAGFNLTPVVDNKKSWVQTGATTRVHNTTPQYYQEDSKLVINTKEIDVALDTARGIEYDVYKYIQKDFAANSSGYTLPYSYVNISLPVSSVVSGQTEFTFELPYTVDSRQGDFEVRYNGVLLNAPSTGSTGGVATGITYQADYTINGNSFTLNGGVAKNYGTRRDVVQATFVNTGGTINSALSGVTVEYIVTRLYKDAGSIYLDLPDYPRGDIQVTINGVALTKGTSQFTADYILDPANSSATGATNRIILQNTDVITFLNSSPEVQVAYMTVTGSDDINMRSEIVRVDSFNTSKIYFNASANKYVYKLNYKATNTSDIKFLVNGVALEPGTDYNINVQNQYEVFLPRGIKYGDVISAYYLVANSGAFQPVVGDNFGLGDISELSFLEFIELIQRKMISARNRKVVTDFKGGWYPALLRIYETYLKRALLPDDNPLQSNGYTFQNLYPFLSKYNAFFQKFVDQLLSATIILKRGGLLVRNSVFTKQKHWYKRGVNVADGLTGNDMRGNSLLQYFGNDGSTFSIINGVSIPPPTVLYVETTEGTLGSLITGGENIQGIEEINEYGIDYKPTYQYASAGSEPIGLENLLEGINFEIETLADNWTRISETIPPNPQLTTDNFSMTLTGLDYGTWYDYRAFVESLSTGATGITRHIQTLPEPLPEPSLLTTTGTLVGNTLVGAGAYDIVRYEDVQQYAVQYRKSTIAGWTSSPFPPATTATGLPNDYFTVPTMTLDYASTYLYRAYMVVDGVAYYGQTITISVGAAPVVGYTIITDPAPTNITTSSFSTLNNIISAVGNEPIIQYGLIYTQNPAEAGGLTVGNTSVGHDNHPGSTGTPFGVGVGASGLSPNTTTWYRAFIQSGAFWDPTVSYGNVQTVRTEDNPITVSIGDTALLSGPYPDLEVHCCGKIVLSDTMASGDGFRLYFTNCGYTRIYNEQLHPLYNGAKACVGGTTCCEAKIPVPPTTSGPTLPGVYDTSCSGFICVTPSTSLSTIPFDVCAKSHAGNSINDFINEACAEFTSISNDAGNTKNYVLSSTERKISARNH